MIKILVISDELGCSRIRAALEQAHRHRYSVSWQPDLQRAQPILAEESFSAVLCGLPVSIPGLDELLQRACRNSPMPGLLLFGGQPDLNTYDPTRLLWLADDELTPTLLERSIAYAMGRAALEEKHAQVTAHQPAIADCEDNQVIVQALTDTQERFRAVWEICVDAMALSDAQGTVIAANPAYYSLYGYTPEQVIGQNFSIIYPEEVRDWANREYQAVFNNPEIPPAFEAVIKRQDGSMRNVESRIAFLTQNGRRTAMLSVIRDITSQKATGAALHDSESRSRVLIDNSPDLIWSAGPDGKTDYINRTWISYTGLTLEELLITGWESLIHPDDAPEVQARWTKAAVTGDSYDIEFRYRRHDGVYGWLWGCAVPVKDETGAIKQWIGYSHDINERKDAAERLQEAHRQVTRERNQLLAVMEALQSGISITDLEGKLLQTNHAYKVIWGSPTPEADRFEDYWNFKAWWVQSGQVVEPEQWASSIATKTGQIVKDQFIEIEGFDGSRKFILNSAAPIFDADKQVIGAIVSIIDVTRLVRLENERREHETQIRVQRMLAGLREKERQAIARDIHDGPIQTLVSTLFNVQVAREAISHPAAEIEFAQITQSLQTTVRELREIINQLRPPALVRFGLCKTLALLVQDYQEKHPGLTILTELDDDGQLLPEDVRLSLYRICQEAMTNVVRHAQARTTTIRLKIDLQQVILEVSDDGQGFTQSVNLLDETNSGHYGLAGMHERAEAIGGCLMVLTEPGRGTTIRIETPLPNRAGEVQS